MSEQGHGLPRHNVEWTETWTRPNRSEPARVGAAFRCCGIASATRHHLAGAPAHHTPTQAHGGSIRPGGAAPTPPGDTGSRNRRAGWAPVFSARRGEAVVPGIGHGRRYGENDGLAVHGRRVDRSWTRQAALGALRGEGASVPDWPDDIAGGRRARKAGGEPIDREGRMTEAVEWVAYVGAPLFDEDGNVVGTIEEFYVETDDGPPAWVVVVDETDGTSRSYVPMRDAEPTSDGDGLQVSVSREEIGDAPRAERGEDLSADEERRLYEHYEQTYPEEKSGHEAQAAHETKSADRPEGEERRPGLLRRLLGRDRR